VIGREHHAEDRGHDIEAFFRKGERFCVRLLDGHRQVLGACPVEKRRNVVCRGDVAPAACGSESGVAVAGGHVEDLRAGADVDRSQSVSPTICRVVPTTA
jgi:hypothetical protein